MSEPEYRIGGGVPAPDPTPAYGQQPQYYGPPPPPPPPHYGPPPPHYGPPQRIEQVMTKPGTDSSKRFLNLSMGALVSIIAGILLVCCVGPIVFCFASPFLAGVSDGLKTDPTVTITGCDIDDRGTLETAKISYRVTNNNSTGDDSYMIKFVVKDGSGARVGDGSDWVLSLSGGQSANGDTTVYLDTKGGTTCSVTGVS